MSSQLDWPLMHVPEEKRNEQPQEIKGSTSSDNSSAITYWKHAILGDTSNCQVYAGKFKGRRVAVKLFSSMTTDEGVVKLALELAAWMTLQHPHVLPFLGYRMIGLRQAVLISPYMENGNMSGFIKKHPNENRVRLLKQVAEGVQYLHRKAGIVHGDLKCANVLISDDHSAILADFGLGTVVRKTAAAKTTSGYIRQNRTVQFAAPELFEDKAKGLSSDNPQQWLLRSKTTYTDVYAFGMLIYEAITGDSPWRGLNDDGVRKKVTEGKRPPRTNEFSRFPNDLWTLCQSCWNPNPLSRPDCVQILKELTKMA